MKIVNLQGGQGSDAWLQFRAGRFGSSEAAAMLGLSPYTTRNELLKLKHLGLAKDFGEWFQAKVLDHGHAVEAATRPQIEDEISDDLYPVTCVENDDSPLVASCDGLTLDGATAWECKQWNEALAADVGAGRVPDTHMPQCQQILMVTGAERLLFTVSDGQTKRVSAEVLPSPEWFSRLRAGWAQFQKDLAAYQLPAAAPAAPVGRAPETLPALRIEVTGVVTASNLETFKTTALTAIRSVNRDLKTDQDFADADRAVKWCGEVEDRLEAAKQHALSQTASIDLLFKTMDDIGEEARKVRLELEKLVKARKEARKGEIVAAARTAYLAHEEQLRAETGGPWICLQPPDFGAAIKGLRSFDSMQNAVDTLVAASKIKADESARKIRESLRILAEQTAGYEALFMDKLALISKAPDDLQAVISSRIAAHKAAEEKRLEAERERIRAEEQEKAQREAQAAVAAAAPVAPAPAAPPAAAPSAAPVSPTPAYRPVFAAAPRPAAASEPATLNLGTICGRLGFTMTATFIAETLGIQHAATDKSARLYRESDFHRICAALQTHIGSVVEALPA